jgi:hypothetical protein
MAEPQQQMDFERGQLAYNTYRVTVGGKSAVTGAPLPEFGETGHLVQAGWIAAAVAVVEADREGGTDG